MFVALQAAENRLTLSSQPVSIVCGNSKEWLKDIPCEALADTGLRLVHFCSSVVGLGSSQPQVNENNKETILGKEAKIVCSLFTIFHQPVFNSRYCLTFPYNNKTNQEKDSQGTISADALRVVLHQHDMPLGNHFRVIKDERYQNGTNDCLMYIANETICSSSTPCNSSRCKKYLFSDALRIIKGLEAEKANRRRSHYAVYCIKRKCLGSCLLCVSLWTACLGSIMRKKSTCC